MTTVAIFTPRTNIILSLVLAAGCIAAAFFLSGRATITPVNAESTQELLRAYATKDTDSDGLPDWQEELYGSDPANPRSIDQTMTDREAVDAGLVSPRFISEEPAPQDMSTVPGIAAQEDTLTDRFAKEFFGSYLQNQTAGRPSEADLAAFVGSAVSTLQASAAKRYSATDITVVATSPESLQTYAALAEAALAAHTVTTQQSEILYFSDAVIKNDNAALSMVGRIGASYASAARALALVPVPEKLAGAHLRTVNALSLMSAVLEDMAAFAEDPLRGFVGLAAYENAVAELMTALREEHAVFVAQGVVIGAGEAGSAFYATLEMALPN